MIPQETILSIVETVLDQGRLTKAQVIECWGIWDHEYLELQSRILDDRRIELGPRGTGGFVAKNPRGRRFVDEAPGDELLLNDGWEAATVQRLEELLSSEQLQELVGDFEKPLRSIRRYENRKDRPSNKPELAAALVLQYGVDLFCNSECRSTIAKACRIRPLKRWHPGKTAAIEFVELTGFPPELSGIPSPEALEDYEYLEGNFKLRPLSEFQVEVKERLEDTLRSSGARAIVTLPTGAGKTRVAVESIRDWLTDRYDTDAKRAANSAVLWLAHTEELCEQAFTCFKQVWSASNNVCPLLLVRFWGKYTQDLVKHRPVLEQALTYPSIFISTPQRMDNVLSGRVHLTAR